MGKSPLKRRRNQAINELQNLKYLPRRYLHLNICTVTLYSSLCKSSPAIFNSFRKFERFCEDIISSAPLNAKLCLKTALLHMQVSHDLQEAENVLVFLILMKLPKRSIYLSNQLLSDHVGFGPDRQTTAAVGILKCVRCEENHEYNRISKVNLI